MTQVLPKERAREYESIFILNPDSHSDVIDNIAGRCQDIISKLEGKLLRAENWGRRKLAYPVRKNQKGIYIYLKYLGYRDLVHELERNFRTIDSIIKFLTVKIDEDVNPEARPVNESDISFVSTFIENESEVVADKEEATETAADGESADAEKEDATEAAAADTDTAEAAPVEEAVADSAAADKAEAATDDAAAESTADESDAKKEE